MRTLFACIVMGMSSSVAWSAPVGEFASDSAHGTAATYNAASQEYVLSASGFQFVWRKLQGDFILQARVELNDDAKAGWLVRRTLDDPSGQIEVTATRRADVIQLERRGNTFTASTARWGEPFTTREITGVDAGAEPYIGLFASAATSSPATTGSSAATGSSSNSGVTFRDVRVIRPARKDFVPYKDYIGTHLELLDIATGHRQIIHSSKVPFEAPNWTRDGAALIYNTSGTDPNTRGRLYRFDLATRAPTLIDTAFANRNNNDHVLSFDGSMLAISDQSTDQGQSTVFTVPATGGVPKRITKLTPSYLHSWSPDGKFLLYTGGRNGELDIYKIASDGSGEEIRLTTAKALDDGPEFTPDGQYIYFNSTRSGRMQIWRMRADGSNPEQVTSDRYNDWFPHISPDGKWLVMISYVDEIPPAEHPYYKHVYLRLMPTPGVLQQSRATSPRVLAYVYGGQGTLNVPSWSPDGRMLAFVSNSDR
jgi:Tol biopolymer transport system component